MERAEKLSELLRSLAADCRVPACTMNVIRSGEVIFSSAAGDCGESTLFDLASVTKLFTSTAFMRLADMGKIRVDDPVCSILPEFRGLRKVNPFPEPLEAGKFRDVANGFAGEVDAGRTTFWQLLTHCSGLPAWLPLYQLESPDAIRERVLSTDFSYEPETDVVYSDLGLILVGWAVEALCGCPLDEAIRDLVTGPLELESVRFRRLDGDMKAIDPLPDAGIAPTDVCHWRKYRLTGEVEDENCAALGGVSGHAGTFGTASDLARLGAAFLPGGDLLTPESYYLMTSLQKSSRDGLMGRGCGFQHWTADPAAFYYLLSSQSFGHTGFTGTALWVDPEREVSAALLTNEVYNGRYGRSIAQFRRGVFAALTEFLEEE